MYVIVALMACSLSTVSAVVLLRHLAVVQTVADREIEQVANDAVHRVSRFLEAGPAVLKRVKCFIEHQDIALTDTERLTDYLVSEAQAGDVPAHVANGRALLINDYAASPVQARPSSLVAGAERAA
jgi:hypothetical protein